MGGMPLDVIATLCNKLRVAGQSWTREVLEGAIVLAGAKAQAPTSLGAASGFRMAAAAAAAFVRTCRQTHRQAGRQTRQTD